MIAGSLAVADGHNATGCVIMGGVSTTHHGGHDMTTRTAERTEFLQDIITTAVENDGYGWFSVSDYDPDNGTARIRDDEEGETYDVNVDVIARGLGIIRNAKTGEDGSLTHASNGQPVYMAASKRTDILECDRDNDASNLDVVDALAVLECGLFGQVSYS